MSKARDLAGLFNLGPRSGTTAQRPATADVGDIYYNGTTGKTEIYTTTGWKEMASGIPFGNNAARPASPTLGTPYFNGEEKRLELYTSSGWQNIVSETPGVVSVSGNYLESVGSATFEITGTNFTAGAVASVVGTNGVEINASSTTLNSIVSVTASFTGLVGANEPYDLKVTNTSNLFGILPDAVYVNNILNWQTAAGSLGSFGEQVSVSVSATAIDDSTLTYSLASGSTLPSGITLNSSTGLISGTLPDIAANTTYTFTINASDGLNPVVPRTFSITSNAAPTWVTAIGSLGEFSSGANLNIQLSATDPSNSLVYSLLSGSLPSGVTLGSSGLISGVLPTISTPTTYSFIVNVSDGINPAISRSFSLISNPIPTSVEMLVVAGGGGGGCDRAGGGGAGGLIYSASYALASNSALITVGTGGAGSTNDGSKGVNGNNSVFFNQTAVGGGGGGSEGSKPGASGGSGGGSSYGSGQSGGAPTSGQGNRGGNGKDNGRAPGGGGGAGAQGTDGADNTRIDGGIGLAYSITGTSTYYAGGGGAGDNRDGAGTAIGGFGGLGGGGNGGQSYNSSGAGTNGSPGTDGLGGGGGGGSTSDAGIGAKGGNGTVIIAYPNTFAAISNIPGTLTYDQPTRAGYRVYRFTAGTGTVTF